MVKEELDSFKDNQQADVRKDYDGQQQEEDTESHRRHSLKSEECDVEPTIVPFSKLGDPPEPCAWWSMPCRILLASFSLFVVLALLPLLPAILLFSLIQRLRFSNIKYRVQPSARVAVIGGGWSGMQCISRLHDLGVQTVRGFERYDSWGGTWHPRLRYHTLQAHGAMWITSFKNFSYSQNKDINDGKIMGEEVENYVTSFGKAKNLDDAYSFDSRVVKIKYSSKTRAATLVVENSRGEQRMEGPFDSVIYAALASEPNLPDIPDRHQFTGQVYHSIDFKKQQYDEIVKNKKKVLVVGGSKAGCDLALCFQRGGYHNFDWVYRKPYLFWKYEAVFHNCSFLNMLRGGTTILGMIVTLFSNRLGGLFFWTSGLAVTHGDTMHNDWTKFHFGILCPKQRRDLRNIPRDQKICGYPKKFTSTGLQLSDGSELSADVVVFCTGCQSGIDKIYLEKDDTPYILDPKTKMLDHFIFPEFPCMANSTALFTTFGPVRAVNSAEMAVYHYCVRKEMTEKEMKYSASRQLGGSTDSISGWLFQSNQSAIKTFLVMHLDLLIRGYVDIFAFLKHVVQLFCLSKQTALEMNMLPKHHKSYLPSKIA